MRKTGAWWSNWTKTYGYSADEIIYPGSVEELSTILSEDDVRPIRAVGGGWSASEVALPFRTPTDVLDALLVDRSPTFPNVADPNVTDKKLLENFDGARVPIDRTSVAFETVTTTHRQWMLDWGLWQADHSKIATKDARTTLEDAGVRGPEALLTSKGVRLVDMRRLQSSLQVRFDGIAHPSAKGPQDSAGGPHYYFHVEAGVPMGELASVLDHHSPRLALRSTSGSPGATLAGALATATHGAELKDEFLVDTVAAIHFVDGRGRQWWIESDVPIANPDELRTAYPGLTAERILSAGKQLSVICGSGVLTVTAADVLSALVVSLGAIGIIYSVVLKVFPQHGIKQVVRRFESWDGLLGTIGKPGAKDHLAVWDTETNVKLVDGLVSGKFAQTGIANNVYCDLAVNPITHECWVTHRERTTSVPVFGSRIRSDTVGALMANAGQVFATIGRHRNTPADHGMRGLFAMFDYLGYANPLDVSSGHDGLVGTLAAANDLKNDIEQLIRLVEWSGQWSNFGAGLLLALAAQSEANGGAGRATRWKIAGNLLTALLDVLQGVERQSAANASWDVSHKVGAIGWPDAGLPGVAIEIALPDTCALSFIQNELLVGTPESPPLLRQDPERDTLLLGYVSVRICGKTRALLGMPQFDRSVMVEIVGCRSIGADPSAPSIETVLDRIEKRVDELNRTRNLGALLHWGLHNELLSKDFLSRTVLGRSIGGLPSPIERFRAIRQHFSGDRFVSAFIERVGL